MGRQGALAHGVFMILLVLNLVGGFHSLGTLMAVAFIVLPAAAARFWVRGLGSQMALAVIVALCGSVVGLTFDATVSWPADSRMWTMPSRST